MTSDNADDSNMRRQRGICYARANGIIKNFSMCSPVVKARLGESHPIQNVLQQHVLQPIMA